MTTLLRVVERIASLSVISTGRGRRSAHLLVVAGQVDLVHGGGIVAQMLRGRKGSRRLKEFETAVAQMERLGAGICVQDPMAVGVLW